MDPIYLDLHIHTSNDPNHLNQQYDLDALIAKVREKAGGNNFLISLTDHNTINERVYLQAAEKIKNNLIVGVELHIQTHKGENTKAYHCHIYFNFDDKPITGEVLKDINSKLDALYPKKAPALKDDNIPLIQQIIEVFDEYDFILLPHGGQTHATFDEALPDGKQFDNAMQRSLYYNFFDGFSSRSDQKTEKTKEYLKKLGVHDFVNLITGTDNYDPAIYPDPKGQEKYKFIPTWMFATPTFNGLRLSLSDSSRLEYSHTKPKKWRESIKSIKLHNDKIDVDVHLSPGLNVIIGESSSGKTLLVDSIYRRICGVGFETSKYKEYDVENIEINYPDNLHPHFIEQNFIINVTREDKKIDEISIIRKILPENAVARKEITKGLKNLDSHLNLLFKAVERIEMLETEIKRIPVLSSLVTSGKVRKNVLNSLLKSVVSLQDADYDEFDVNNDLELLDRLDEKLELNPFIKHDKKLVKALKQEINEAGEYARLESNVRTIIAGQKKQIDQELKEKEGESQGKKQDFDSLINKMKEYYKCLIEFDAALMDISNYSIESNSGKNTIEGYTLSVENTFRLNKDIVKDELNKLLLKEKEIASFKDIIPERLFRNNFKNNLKGSQRGSSPTYKLIKENISSNLIENDQVKYKITTPEGRDFDSLSPGLKTAIILELVLNFDGDSAPLVIDQPEDNLATSYMNEGLVKSIKRMKRKKQIIFVSHSATIPMAGDAQNVILCRNNGGKIEIRSNPLEGKIDDVNVVDYIAKIADGGKSSVKKRFKKYNLKSFK